MGSLRCSPQLGSSICWAANTGLMVYTGSQALDTPQFLALSVPLCKRSMLSWDSLKGPSRLKSSHHYHSRSSLHFLDFLPSPPPPSLLCYSPLGISSSVPPVAPSWPPDPD